MAITTSVNSARRWRRQFRNLLLVANPLCPRLRGRLIDVLHQLQTHLIVCGSHARQIAVEEHRKRRRRFAAAYRVIRSPGRSRAAMPSSVIHL